MTNLNLKIGEKIMEILNAQQAFEVMSSGQTVLCRAIGDLLEFDELRNFPATVFFGTEYEFCIAPRFMSIGHLDLDVPECIQGFDDLVNTAMYYVPNLLDVDRPIEILSNANNKSYLERLIVAKLLHKKSGDAITHARAFITLNGGSLDYVEAPAVEKKPKKPSRKKEAFTVDEVQAVETDPEKLIANFTAQINECESVDAVLSVRSTFACNGHLDREHVQALCKLVEEKNAELDPQSYTSIDYSASIKEEIMYKVGCMNSQELDAIAVEINNNSKLISTHKSHLAGHIELRRKVLAKETTKAQDNTQNTKSNDVAEKPSDNLVAFKSKQIDADALYQEALKDLVDRANKASTPVEANALLKYTASWQPEQKTPLIQAINNRLIVLGQQKEKPSLMVQIQQAQDLTELDAFEIDVSGCDPEIQPKLMQIVEKRRGELTG